MGEYQPDKIKEKKAKEGLEYKTVGAYTINITSNKASIPHSIETVVSKSWGIGWKLRDRDAINPQNVNLEKIKSKDIGKIIQQVYSITEGTTTNLKSILKNHKALIKDILADYKKFDYKKEFKK